MKIINSSKVVLAKDIENGTVFTGSIGGASLSTYFKGREWIICLEDGLHWYNLDDCAWTLKIHNYIHHKGATLTL